MLVTGRMSQRHVDKAVVSKHVPVMDLTWKGELQG